jgi:hypothetical protein
MSEKVKEMSQEKITSLRNFGLLVGGIIAAYFAFRIQYRFGANGSYAGLLIGLSGVILGLIKPTLLSPFYSVWMKLASALGWFNTRLILGLVFFFMVLPVGLFAKWILRRDLLDAAFEPAKESYWHDKPKVDFKPEHLERMF